MGPFELQRQLYFLLREQEIFPDIYKLMINIYLSKLIYF